MDEKEKMPGGGPELQHGDRLKGKLLAGAITLAAAELLVFWWLVFNWPPAMLPVSAGLAFLSHRMRRGQNRLAEMARELTLGAGDLEWIRRYLKAWIFISCYGFLFAAFLLLRGN